MIKAIEVREAKLIDKKASRDLGISTLVIMENAGRSVAEEIIKLKEKKIAIFCGKGNNGGDGFVCARQLLCRGIKPDVFLLGKIEEIKNEARVNLDILFNLGLKVLEVNEENLDKIKFKEYTLIVDAIFGIGLKGEITGFFKEIIDSINLSGAYIVSIDIPSGLNANTGEIFGSCIKADKTITFFAKKIGMLKNRGPEYCGEIIIKDLGFPSEKIW
ncbi:MAG: NAD(P)H-hydrate epimerase [Candidatus Omnitrophica bacterium]|nr:NAD(P)H-hydrate epimerase [Candidatus Omnitrophota bacterium]MCM8794074.1 NAD(P)H-hydrate epimerase [Candidatus Omnitrophota bacterium]